MPVNIHGKEYRTVAERLDEIGTKLTGVETEVLFLDPQIMVKATITTDRGTFTGISAADPNKAIEAKTPVEVAETSAVGRALAFAGYAGSEIASADEMEKAGLRPTPQNDVMERYMDKGQKCKNCGAKMVKNPKTGKWFCEDKCWLNPTSEQVADDVPF